MPGVIEKLPRIFAKRYGVTTFVDCHRNCSEFLLGPAPRIPGDSESGPTRGQRM